VKRQEFAFALMVMFAAGAGLSPLPTAAQNAPQEPGAVPFPQDDQPGGTTPPSGAAQGQREIPWPDSSPSDAATAPAPQDDTAMPTARDLPPAQDAAPAETAQPSAPDQQPVDKAEPAGPPASQEQNAQSDTLPAAPATEPAQSAEQPAPAAEPSRAESPAPAVEAPAAKAEEPAPKPEEPRPAQAVVTPPPPAVDPKSVTLTIATWGGAYGESQDRAYFQPFTSRFGYRIKSVTYDGSYDAIKSQAGSPEWSLVDVDGETASRACEERLLEPLDASMLENAPNGATIAEDFQPGAIRPCAVASVAWSAVVVYDKRQKRKPDSVADFFDPKRFPGKRALPRQPKYSLELALMADGVAPADVYTTLATPEGQDRAFAKLATIKDDIVWWEKPAEVFERLLKKEAVMGLGFNGRAFMAIVGGRQPIDILWDHQIYSFDYWAIPRGAPHQDAARAFIRFATSPGPLSDQTRWMPYGPARRSALQLVGKHAEIDMDMKPFLPTYEPNQKTALAADEAWWAADGGTLQQRFADWVQGRNPSVQRGDSTTQ